MAHIGMNVRYLVKMHTICKIGVNYEITLVCFKKAIGTFSECIIL